MATVGLSDRTRRLVEHLFLPQERTAAVALLEAECGANLPFMSRETPESLERIRFAALRLSHGSMAELRRAVSVAKVDWRDVLVAAQFANDLDAHQAWLRE